MAAASDNDHTPRSALHTKSLYGQTLWSNADSDHKVSLVESESEGDDDSSNEYSPVRHLGAALFPFDCGHKYMLMLTTYMDETGHSKDEKQKFNGMAGLMTKEENWRIYEREWRKILKHFKIPYIHMKEARKMFKGWPEAKVKDLSRCVWEIIVGIEVLPIGSIIPMDEFRPLEAQLRDCFLDPYYIAMQDCMFFATSFLMEAGAFKSDIDARVAMVFSDQAEFRCEAMRLFDAAKKNWRGIKTDKIDPPAFRDMKVLTPLQAADIVAYEIYKEYDRLRYHPNRKQRYGYTQLEKVFENFKNEWLGRMDFVMWHSKYSLSDLAGDCQKADEAEKAKQKKKRAKKN